MATELNLEQKLADLLDTRNFHPETLGKDGRPSDTDEAKTFSFDYVSGTGKNYGTMVVILGDDNEMYIMYGDNLGKTIENPQDREEFFQFQQQLSDLANRNRWTATLTDLSKLRRVQAGIAAIKEGLFEGYYGTRRVSYNGEPTEARLMIKHNRTLGENDARFRYVESIFIETADGERFKLPFTHMTGARAMLEHVRQGGKPYDIRGNHICEMVTELKTLSRFNRAATNRVMEGVTQQIVEQAQQYYKKLRESLKHLGSNRGYAAYFESWHPLDVQEQESLVEDIKTMFIEQTLDTRIEAALPLLARIQQQGNDMKEADIFESWANKLLEGTWSLPETPEQVNKLKELMSKELIVGPDATNATEQLYDLVGDDVLFDRLSELAQRDPRANVWNDTEVMDRLRELGVETEGIAPAGAEGDAAPAEEVPAEVPVAPEQQPVAEGSESPESELERLKLRQNAWRKAPLKDQAATQARIRELEKQIKDKKGVEEDLEEALNKILKLAQVPVNEGRILDESGETLEHILDRFKHEVHQFEQGEELDDDLYDALYDYYANSGEMPYGTMKARTGDPYEWVTQRLDQELGTGNFAPRLPEADTTSTFEVVSGFDAPSVVEGSCNHTMEGEYCPEHGLMECGAMEESMGGTVAGSVAPVVDEAEELDEISKSLAARYKKAAIKDVDTAIAAKAAGTMGRSEYERKMTKRGRGVAAADRRLTPHGTQLDLSPHGDAIQKDYDRYRTDEQGVAEGSLNPKARAKAQMLKMYGDGNITFRKTSNGGYFIQHEDDFGDTNSHQYDPATGKVDFSGVTSSSYHGYSEGVAEAAGLYGPFTATINTGERPQSRTKTKRFKREDDAILWAEDWLENAPQYVYATAEVTDPDGNVVWTTDESLEEVSLDLAKRARDKAEHMVDMDYDDMRDKPYGHSEKQRIKFQRYIDKKEPRAKGDRDWSPPEQGVAEGQLDESSTIDFIRGLISEFNKEMSGSPYYPMDYKNPGMRMWTRGDGSKYKDPGYIFIDRDLKPEDQPKWQKAGAVEKFWKFLESKGARKIGDVSGEFGSDPHSPAVVLNKLIFVFNGRSIAWGSTSRLKNSNVWRQKQQGVAEGNDDPMNYNAAITGSYYESADPLARIKELALRK